MYVVYPMKIKHTCIVSGLFTVQRLFIKSLGVVVLLSIDMSYCSTYMYIQVDNCLISL